MFDDVEALVSWARDEFGGPVALRGEPEAKGEGFDSAIFLLELTGASLPDAWRQPLVLRIKGDADRLEEARQEAAVQGWLADRGYPAPRVLAVFGPGEMLDRPAQVMERAPGRLMLDAVVGAPWTARRLAVRLADAHAALHAMPTEGFPGPSDLLDRRLRLTRHAAEALDDGPLRSGLDRVATIAEELRAAPLVICHGDFHPLNVLVDDRTMTVIDWTDTGLGDRHGDIARTAVLFGLASIAAGSAVERAALRVAGPLLGRTYLRAYRRHAPVDDRRIALWSGVHLLHGWSQARSLHAGLFDRGEVDDDRTERVPQSLIAELERRFDRAMSAVGA